LERDKQGERGEGEISQEESKEVSSTAGQHPPHAKNIPKEKKKSRSMDLLQETRSWLAQKPTIRKAWGNVKRERGGSVAKG